VTGRRREAAIVVDVSRRPTIRDVAELAGVSSATVSFVMNDKGGTGPETRRRVLRAATALGYAPDASARSLATQRTQLVGVLMGDACGHGDVTRTFFGKVVDAISRHLEHAGYGTLLLGAASSRFGAPPPGPRLAHRFDGAILIGVADGDTALDELAATSLPCVAVDLKCVGPATACVGSDSAMGIQLAVRHLHALGHRRIATIAGASQTVAGAERLEAFRHETARLGLDVPGDYLRRGDFSAEAGYREACALLGLPNPPSALVVASDLMALAALQAVRRFELEPGRDVAVVGFDDLDAARLSHPPLTTIRQDRDALGALAATRVVELIEQPGIVRPRELLPVQLVVRESSGGHVAAGPRPVLQPHTPVPG
jgi:LacI family transcriptional regulator